MRSLAPVIVLSMLSVPAMAERPDTPSVGVGIGITVPSGPVGINTGSVRLRLSDSFAIEPTIAVLTNSSKEQHDAEENDEDLTTVTANTTPVIGAQARFLAGRRGPVDLTALVGANLSSGNFRQRVEIGDPDADEPTIEPSSSFAFGLGAGLGVEAFVKKHWSVGLDANVPLVRVSSTTTPSTPTDSGNDDIDRTSSTSLTLGWSPTVTLFTHLYF